MVANLLFYVDKWCTVVESETFITAPVIGYNIIILHAAL